MKPAKRILDRVAAGQLTTGVLVTEQLFGQMVDYFQRVGLDYMIIDCEHGAYPDDLIVDVCTLGRMTDFAVLLRPIDCEYATIRRAIDRGPCGFLLPNVESAADLDRVRDAIYMPPRGSRRPGGLGNYWVSDYSAETWKAVVEDNFIVLPQIETVKGLNNADEIAAHEITTAIAIGPYDLSHSIGVNSQMDHPDMIQAVARIREAGGKVAKTMWRIGEANLVAEGCHFICLGEAMAHLKNSLTQAIERAQEATNK